MGSMLGVSLSTFATEAFPNCRNLQNKSDRERISLWPDDLVTHFAQQPENMKRGQRPSLILSLSLAPVDVCHGPASDS